MRLTEISHPSQLDALLSFSVVETDLGLLTLSSQFNTAEKQKLENDLNKHYYDNGREMAVRGAGIGATVAFSMLFSHWTLLDTNWSQYVLNSVITFLSLWLIGKLAGVVMAHVNLTKTVRTIKSHWHPVFA